jgi:hypothetical protein
MEYNRNYSNAAIVSFRPGSEADFDSPEQLGAKRLTSYAYLGVREEGKIGIRFRDGRKWRGV